jgi:hypothetical protein
MTTTSWRWRCLSCPTTIDPPPDEVSDEARRHLDRGLCAACYARSYRTGELHRYPRFNRTLDRLVVEYLLLRAYGLSLVAVATALDMSQGALLHHLRRARSRGLPV